MGKKGLLGKISREFKRIANQVDEFSTGVTTIKEKVEQAEQILQFAKAQPPQPAPQLTVPLALLQPPQQQAHQAQQQFPQEEEKKELPPQRTPPPPPLGKESEALLQQLDGKVPELVTKLIGGRPQEVREAQDATFLNDERFRDLPLNHSGVQDVQHQYAQIRGIANQIIPDMEIGQNQAGQNEEEDEQEKLEKIAILVNIAWEQRKCGEEISLENAIRVAASVAFMLDTQNDEIKKKVSYWFKMSGKDVIDKASMKQFIRLYYYDK
ncbi:hypothetical protein FGO68_gene11852 [Halteria grandinella]|uniref:Uncharacterized protein n=1 Tax=Halteria grandinella TaxID=5974 RepID=A0A8J8SZK1_HALGN|nr:hypothetical protein FGO68_gene11852 [Halteria grandinella]